MNGRDESPFGAIVLAAGEGTRMRSRRPKVLHELAGRSMLAHVLAQVSEVAPAQIAVVLGPDRADVAGEVARQVPTAATFTQTERRGTAHAVLAARDAIRSDRHVLILFGDTPLVRAETIRALIGTVRDGAAVGVLAFEAANPTGYGRVIRDHAGRPVAIREERDASDTERKSLLCNAGLMAINGAHALALLDAVKSQNSKGEFYLTDVVALAVERGLSTALVEAPEADVLGINDRVQLAGAEAILQDRLRADAMRGGATLQDPQSTFLSFDTELDADVVVEPHVVFGVGVKVRSGSVIHAFSHLAGVEVGEDVSVGPFARLRPGTTLGARARVGNFVEVKAATISAGAKVNHLSYIGDASIGAGANIGAGTITCNYDGFGKHRTEIGPGAFVGSNSSLVAPVSVGAGAYIGSGSVITDAVEPDALAIARGRQSTKPGWAAAFRASQKDKLSR